MEIVWGLLTVTAGLFLLICGSMKSKFLIYHLLVCRSRILWGDNVHRFHQVAGGMVIIFGILMSLGYF